MQDLESPNENQPPESIVPTELVLDEKCKYHLIETAKWAKFLAIVFFVCIGLMVVFGFFFSTIMGAFMPQDPDNPFSGFMGFFSIFYILMGILYYFPTIYLYRFATNITKAIKGLDQPALGTAFEKLKSVFKFWGMFTLIVLVIYGLMFLVSMLGLLF